MQTSVGRISKLAVVVISVLIAAVGLGLVIPGRTGKWIEVGAWLAICLLVISRLLRTTPVFGERSEGDERRREGERRREEERRAEGPRPFPFNRL